ncbi:LysE family translocator [Lichenifustis flavocetrariae]|uniref:LysE family translocator n=1 Tax=Lichenifustis flavocetrariae TaxID=2949735 RepID=A0AA42CIE3_9HYPH|nr:LysE family translocator [Lichenifustis flavocetrariae]MCW6508493.1 LysE family translocator [Lichenifustis flavocetrariae]
MEFHVWLGFVAAAALLGVVPGPGVLSIIGYAVGSGRRVALASVAGMAVGNASAMSLSLAGVGALLAASALAFSIMKWAGAVYLVGLGVITIVRSRSGAFGGVAASAPITARAAFMGNVAVGTFHPKTIVFFVAFVPQFISPDGDYISQAALLVVTFVGVVGVTDTIYAVAASQASHLLRGPRMSTWSRRAGGGALIAAGVATAAARN